MHAKSNSLCVVVCTIFNLLKKRVHTCPEVGGAHVRSKLTTSFPLLLALTPEACRETEREREITFDIPFNLDDGKACKKNSIRYMSPVYAHNSVSQSGLPFSSIYSPNGLNIKSLEHVHASL